MNRQRVVLPAALLLLVLSIVWGFLSYPRQKTVAKLKYPPGVKVVAERYRKPPAAPGSKPSGSRALRLDLLEHARDFTEYRRDIFKPLFVDRETMMQRRAAAEAAEAERRARKLRAAQAPIKPPPTPTGIQTELSAFKFHGFLSKDGRKTVFLAKGADISPLRQGSTFAGRYVATSITDQVLILKVLGTGEEIIIPLVENEPLRGTR